MGEPFTRRPSGADFGRTPILFFISITSSCIRFRHR
nr:MAG TPA: hypothetical protein [Caudoviricetes sp.]